jgi:hypothetical protein
VMVKAETAGALVPLAPERAFGTGEDVAPHRLLAERERAGMAPRRVIDPEWSTSSGSVVATYLLAGRVVGPVILS